MSSSLSNSMGLILEIMYVCRASISMLTHPAVMATVRCHIMSWSKLSPRTRSNKLSPGWMHVFIHVYIYSIARRHDGLMRIRREYIVDVRN